MLHIIGGIHRRRSLKSPKGEQTRPSTSQLREAVFNICQQELENARFLDLFAGAGAMGLEALSRGASQAVFVEKDRNALQAIQENILILKEEVRSKVMKKDVFAALNDLNKQQAVFDLIFADPPYGKGLSDEILLFLDAHPTLLTREGMLFLEDEREKSQQEPHLQTLLLKSSRRIGRAWLRQYVKVQN